MSLGSFAFIFSGVILNAAAQLFLKTATQKIGALSLNMRNLPLFSRLVAEPALWGGLFCYGISLIVWIIGLSRVPVSVAYPMLSLGYVLNAIGAWWLFGEVLVLQQYVGLALILTGVFFLAKS